MNINPDIKNLVCPPVTGIRAENMKKYQECKCIYADGHYVDGVWLPDCGRDCEHCGLYMVVGDYLKAMTDVALRW